MTIVNVVLGTIVAFLLVYILKVVCRKPVNPNYEKVRDQALKHRFSCFARDQTTEGNIFVVFRGLYKLETTKLVSKTRIPIH